MLTSRTHFRFTNFQFFHKYQKWRRPLLYQLFIKAVHISTMWTQTKWSQALWLTNDKASYVAKEDSICLLSVAKGATLNKQGIKLGVPLCFPSLLVGYFENWCYCPATERYLVFFLIRHFPVDINIVLVTLVVCNFLSTLPLWWSSSWLSYLS